MVVASVRSMGKQIFDPGTAEGTVTLEAPVAKHPGPDHDVRTPVPERAIRRCLWVVACVALAIACKGEGDGGADPGAGGAGGTALTEGDGQAPKTLTCPVSVEEACASMPPTPSGYESCVDRWSAVANDTRACELIGDGVIDCSPYKVRELTNADRGTYYFYDAASGDIAAVVHLGNPGVFRCLGGPSTFVIPAGCASKSPMYLPNDCGGAGGSRQ
jgi:hypothetical protein